MIYDSLLFSYDLVQILEYLLLLLGPTSSVVNLTERLDLLVHKLSFASHILILPIGGLCLPVFHLDL